MKLDINEVYHNYIIKVVIFSLFLYKRNIRDPHLYKVLILGYLKKRIPWDINLIITIEQPNKDIQRNLIIDDILYDKRPDFLSVVTIDFKTPLKEVKMIIDLREEDKYEKFIYS